MKCPICKLEDIHDCIDCGAFTCMDCGFVWGSKWSVGKAALWWMEQLEKGVGIQPKTSKIIKVKIIEDSEFVHNPEDGR